MNDLGNRQKSYEDSTRLPKGAVIVRVDGKAFHTWTKRVGVTAPFDAAVVNCMGTAAATAAGEMQGFKLAYIQSDECTFVLANTGAEEQGWFDYKVQKLVSITASIFTWAFNTAFFECCRKHKYTQWPAFFDARAFSIPVEDVANNIVWRQQDWARNSVQKLGSTYLKHSELQGKSNNQVLALLAERSVTLDDLPAWARSGQFIIPGEEEFVTDYLDYYKLNELMGFDVTN
jgi:tRNA(His) 5'-end guanylyltransferase